MDKGVEIKRPFEVEKGMAKELAYIVHEGFIDGDPKENLRAIGDAVVVAYFRQLLPSLEIFSNYPGSKVKDYTGVPIYTIKDEIENRITHNTTLPRGLVEGIGEFKPSDKWLRDKQYRSNFFKRASSLFEENSEVDMELVLKKMVEEVAMSEKLGLPANFYEIIAQTEPLEECVGRISELVTTETEKDFAEARQVFEKREKMPWEDDSSGRPWYRDYQYRRQISSLQALTYALVMQIPLKLEDEKEKYVGTNVAVVSQAVIDAFEFVGTKTENMDQWHNDGNKNVFLGTISLLNKHGVKTESKILRVYQDLVEDYIKGDQK